uniref:Uncharacterized protein n=1 Tax=Anopheles melas TaxID=34690 RepID=A0A182TQP7_9DIPT
MKFFHSTLKLASTCLADWVISPLKKLLDMLSSSVRLPVKLLNRNILVVHDLLVLGDVDTSCLLKEHLIRPAGIEQTQLGCQPVVLSQEQKMHRCGHRRLIAPYVRHQIAHVGPGTAGRIYYRPLDSVAPYRLQSTARECSQSIALRIAGAVQEGQIEQAASTVDRLDRL